jgi:serine protease Do
MRWPMYMRFSGSRSPFTFFLCAASVTMFALAPALGNAENRTHSLEALAGFNESLRDLSARVSPSVAQIVGNGYGMQSDVQRSGTRILSAQRSMGSGIVVSADGYIMTNAHVVEGAHTIRVNVNRHANGQPSVFQAKLAGVDKELDLALLKIEAAGLTPLPFANSRDVEQGQLALAFGSPLGMDNSVSMGIVSAPSRQLNEDDPKIYVQTDAPINPGNSGGPLVDIEGRVIGMNTFILTQSGGGEGLGFAIPSNVIRYAYASLRRDGHVHRGQIGASVRTITHPLATAFGLEQDTGVLVEDVQPEGPADRAGVDVGDVLLSFGGTSLHNVRDLYLQQFEYSLGDSVELQILRNGKKLATRVAVMENRNDSKRLADMVSPEKNLVEPLAILGLTLSDEIAQSLLLRIDSGVLVVGLATPAQYFGDQPREGDVIHALNGTPVTDVESLRAQLTALKPGEPTVLQVERNGGLKFLVLESN